MTEWRVQEDYLEARRSKTPKKGTRLKAVELHSTN